MIYSDSIKSQFKKISIRGRLAFGATCIEQYLIENKIKNELLNHVIESIWEFTTSKRLDLWDEKIRELDPLSLLDDHPDNNTDEYLTLSENKHYQLKDLYEKLPKDLKEMIIDTIEIGGGNLYGGTGDWSEHTLKPTLNVYKIAKNVLLKMPDIDIFNISKFTEFHGWGNPIEKKYFKV